MPALFGERSRSDGNEDFQAFDYLPAWKAKSSALAATRTREGRGVKKTIRWIVFSRDRLRKRGPRKCLHFWGRGAVAERLKSSNKGEKKKTVGRRGSEAHGDDEQRDRQRSAAVGESFFRYEVIGGPEKCLHFLGRGAAATETKIFKRLIIYPLGKRSRRRLRRREPGRVEAFRKMSAFTIANLTFPEYN